MNDDQKSTLWIGSFRYYCGRMTYAVGNFVDMLVAEWGSLPDHTRSIIARDLEEEFRRDDLLREQRSDTAYGLPLGHNCDREQWERVRELYREEGK